MANELPVKVSVIIPCYNVEKYLRECLDSVVNQTLKEIEIICINDGSPDRSLDILKEYQKQDSRFVIIDQENQGVGRARNNGIKAARGEFICFMDPDDWYPESDVLEVLYFSAKKEGVKICGGSLEEIKEDGTVVRDFNPKASNWGGKFFKDEKTRFSQYQYDWGYQRFIFERKFILDNEIFFPPYIRFQDPPFFVKAMVWAKVFYALRKITYSYRVIYKSAIWKDEKKVIALFRGVRDCIILAKQDNLERLIERYAQYFSGEWITSQWLPIFSRSYNVRKAIQEAYNELPLNASARNPKNLPEQLKKDLFQQDAPLVSVIVPVYNAEKYIQKCLENLSSQTLKDLEIVCVNDGSTDNSLFILEKSSAADPRIKIYSQPNGGEGAAKNAGIQHAQGKYVAILDPDDYVDLDFYEKLADEAIKSGAIVVKGNSKIVRGNEISIPAWSLNSNIRENINKLPLFACFYYQHCTALYNREFLIQNQITFGGYSVGADILFLLRLGIKTNSISIVDDVSHYYVQSETGVSRIYNEQYFTSNIAYIAEAIDLLNARGKFDDAYYTFLITRFKQLVNVVFPQLSQSDQEQDFKAKFVEQVHVLAQKVKGECLQIKSILASPRFTQVFSNSTCRFSVIIPVYNVEKYLRECLDSVCGQDLREIEIICVNDGSTDGSLAILEDYAKRDSRISVISQKNSGQGVGRNVGVSLSNGEFVYFMDADDKLAEGALSKMYSLLKNERLDVLFFSATSFYETQELEQTYSHYKTYYTRQAFEVSDGQTLGVQLQKSKSNFVSPCCYCCRKSFWDENKIQFPGRCLYEDNAVFWKILLVAKRAKSIEDKLFLRRVRRGSVMTTLKLGFRNFEGYAKIVSILEKSIQSPKKLSSEFIEILKVNADAFGRTLVNFYRKISPEDRARSRELLCNELRDSEWLNPVRENIAKIEGIDLPMAGNLTVPAGNPVATQTLRENPCSSVVASTPECSKKIPRLLVRLGAMFIWNKAARKRWRERHMDLTPKNGIDIHAHPELRRDSALKRFAVRFAALFILNKGARKRFREAHLNLIPRDGIDVNLRGRAKSDSALKRFGVRVVSLFIFSKKKRKAFRARHMDLTPKNGVDVNALSPEERRLRKQKKRERNPLRRLFNAVVPASRSKVAHTEKRIIRHMEWQTQQILSAIKGAQAQSERRFNELKQEIARAQKGLSANIKTELDQVRERADVVSREQLARMDAQKKFFAERAEILSRELDGLSSALTAGLSSQTAAVSNLASAQKALRASVIESYAALEKCKPNSLEFRTFGDLAHCIRTNLHKLPADADLVVGVPRSGMIPAYTIALFMNKRCCSLDEFLSDTEISTGARPVGAMSIRKVLVVDDSCFSGSALARTKERLKAVAGKYEFVFAAVYGRTESADKLDCCLELVDGRRVWQWNYLNHSLAGSACFDMDGVLCADPTPEENDDGAKYLNFIKNAKPLYIPSYKIRAIVTSRLEKYREPTETWLREHGVQYDELVMLNMATAEERRRANCHAAFKAEAYKARERTTLFVESEERQAKEIAFLSGKDVLCVATDKLY